MLTEQEQQKLWEWCGIHCHQGSMGLVCESWSDDGITCFYADDKLPLIDLNNLFKYAVPKLGISVSIEFDFYEGKVSWDNGKTWYKGKYCDCCITTRDDKEYYGGAPDPAEALARALLKMEANDAHR